MLDTVVGAAAPDALTLGHQLWGGLAAIVVAWTGLKIAYSGTLEPWAWSEHADRSLRKSG